MPVNTHPEASVSLSRIWFAVVALGAFGALGALGTTACSRSGDDLREWRPTDHAQPPAAAPGPQAQPIPRPAAPGTAPQPQAQATAGAATEPHGGGLDPLTIRVWAQNCVRCHGQTGRGDGPDGRMFKMTNLGSPEWQTATSDAAMAEVIRAGRGSMPASGLPASTIDNLVKLIRLLGPRSAAPVGATPATGAPPMPGPTPPGPKTPAGGP